MDHKWADRIWSEIWILRMEKLKSISNPTSTPWNLDVGNLQSINTSPFSSPCLAMVRGGNAVATVGPRAAATRNGTKEGSARARRSGCGEERLADGAKGPSHGKHSIRARAGRATTMLGGWGLGNKVRARTTTEGVRGLSPPRILDTFGICELCPLAPPNLDLFNLKPFTPIL